MNQRCRRAVQTFRSAKAGLKAYATIVLLAVACGGGTLTEIQRVKSGAIDVVLLSPTGAIKHGQDSFTIEFRNADGSLVDVGDVKASSTMPMPASPMFGSLEVKKSPTAGRYTVDARFDMAGTWRTTITWAASPSPGAATLSTNIQ